MGEQIAWSFVADVAGGPQAAFGGQLETEAYVKIEVSVAAGADNSREIALQPSTEASFLLITASKYGDELTYSINIGQSDVRQRRTLDAPLILIGRGAVDLVGSPTSLFIYNGFQEEVTVSVLVGRSAAPAS